MQLTCSSRILLYFTTYLTQGFHTEHNVSEMNPFLIAPLIIYALPMLAQGQVVYVEYVGRRRTDRQETDTNTVGIPHTLFCRMLEGFPWGIGFSEMSPLDIAATAW